MVIRKIAVDDMRAVGKAEKVLKALFRVEGVVKVITSIDDNTAEVTYDERKVVPENLIEALRKEGFKPPESKIKAEL